MERDFTVVLEPLEEGGFLVLVPGFPEVATFGSSEAEALTMAEDAIRLALEYRRDRGEAIPAERIPHLHRVRVALPA